MCIIADLSIFVFCWEHMLYSRVLVGVVFPGLLKFNGSIPQVHGFELIVASQGAANTATF